jgi:hypothetical protein
VNALEWTALGVTVTILSTIIGLVVRLMDRINQGESKADAAGKQASTALSRVIDAEKGLVDIRVEVAKEYVSKDTLASLENRIVQAINNLGDRLDKLLQTR